MVIATNESYKAIDIERGKKDPGSIFVVRNGPDLNDKIFQTVPPDPELKAMGKYILVYIGVMGPQDGVDYLVRAIWSLVHKFKRTDFFCLIIGHGDELENLKELAAELDLGEYVRFTGFIPKSDLIRYLSTSDICLDPNPSNPLNDHSTWVKVLEYMAFGKPMVSFDLKETRFSAMDAAVYALVNDEDDYARKIIHLMDNPDERRWRGEAGNKRMREVLAWQHVSENLIKGYDSLFYRSNGREGGA
jgi:glycosyltransferase involved in cell wall biosynthesis